MARSASDPAPAGTAAASGAARGEVSVVICTKDRPTDLARAIASIRTSSEAGRQAEIVVVEEADVPREVPDVHYVHLAPKGRGFGYARNVGLRAATGDFLAFMDDDCVAEAGWLDSLIAPLRDDPKILGVAGTVLVRDCNLIGYAENILGFPGGGLRYMHEARVRVVPTRYLSTCNCAYRKEAVIQAGGFPEGARLGGEDFLLAERVATLGPCLYSPDAVVHHRPRGCLPAVFRWFMRRGESEIMLLHATTAARTFRWYLLQSSWTVRLMLLMVLLAWWPQLAILLLPAGILYYGLILWRFRFARAYPSHRRAWWLVPLVKITMDLGAELGRWRGLLSRGRR
jgi:GT2 family glycosyltransferase